jgi:spermidine synthase
MVRQTVQPTASPDLRRPWVWLFFFVSGVTGLVLEVVWTRQLTAVFGNTVFAASTVLTCFMLGLAGGSFWLGRRADRHPRPLQFYGLLELGVGLCAAVFPWLLDAAGALYGVFFRAATPGFGLMTAVRFACSLALLLPPTFLMGGTLPVLTRHLSQGREEAGREAGYLYGLNTLGGVVGGFLAGFVLIEMLGVRETLWVAATAALLVGSAAVGMGRRALPVSVPVRKSKPRAAEVPNAPSAPSFRVLAVMFGLSGFCALAYEVIWTRVLLFLLTTTVYAFAIMLTTFLVGNAVGALISSRWLVPRIRQPARGFGGLQLLAGLSALFSGWLLARLPDIELGFILPVHVGGRWEYLVNYFADAAVVMLLPTLLMGAAFPLMTHAGLRGTQRVGARLGRLYAVNTLGCVLGSLLAGFALIPLLGTPRALVFVALLNTALGAVLLLPDRFSPTARWLGVAGGTVVIGLVLPARVAPDAFGATLNAYHQPSRLIFVREHATGTVTVHDLPNGDRLISVDGVDVAGRNFMLRTTQKLQGYLPLLLHPHPEKVAQIGFGCGETARVGLEFGVPHYTVVEICPAVFAAGEFFRDLNHGAHRDPRIRRIIMDGKNFMRLTGERFDVIMNDSIYPGSNGSSALYTVDHFRQCREHLAPGGLFSCWVPLDLRPSEMRMILRSFLEVFPHASFWIASNCVNKNGVIMGTREPLRIDFQRVKALCERPALREDLRAIAIENVLDLLDCHMLDAGALRAFVDDAPLNSDDHPRLEFSCARKLPWRLRLRTDLAALTLHRASVLPKVVHFADPEKDRAGLERRFKATTHIFRAQIAQLALQPKLRRAEMDAARKVNPGEIHVGTIEAEVTREITDLKRLLRMYPGDATLQQRLADAYYVTLDYGAARPLYRRLTQNAPAYSDGPFVRLAEIEFNQGNAQEAEQILRRALRYWPRSPEVYDRLAGIHLRAGRLAPARAAIQRAVQLAPDNPIYRAHQQRIQAARFQPRSQPNR